MSLFLVIVDGICSMAAYAIVAYHVFYQIPIQDPLLATCLGLWLFLEVICAFLELLTDVLVKSNKDYKINFSFERRR